MEVREPVRRRQKERIRNMLISSHHDFGDGSTLNSLSLSDFRGCGDRLWLFLHKKWGGVNPFPAASSPVPDRATVP